MLTQVMADLEQEVARVATAHARLVRAAEGKLRDFGIPTEELGFLPQVVASGAGGAGGGVASGSGGGGGGGGVGFGFAKRIGGGGKGSKGSNGGGGGGDGRVRQHELHVSVNQAGVKA